jgi:hypothetical protein
MVNQSITGNAGSLFHKPGTEKQAMQELHAVVERWAQKFNDGNAEAIARLHSRGSTIWGTPAQRLITSDEEIKGYFAGAARAGLRVKLGEHVSSLISETSAIDTGYCEFSRTAHGQASIFPARYTFLPVKQNSAWLLPISIHSMLPKPGG